MSSSSPRVGLKAYFVTSAMQLREGNSQKLADYCTTLMAFNLGRAPSRRLLSYDNIITYVVEAHDRGDVNKSPDASIKQACYSILLFTTHESRRPLLSGGKTDFHEVSVSIKVGLNMSKVNFLKMYRVICYENNNYFSLIFILKKRNIKSNRSRNING
uniref:Uncharacterized protein n=1 Tax=Heterorhabditis bacteriophora TaxID=37862 RepID=A0A1I7WEZ5_HETBA